MVERKYRTDPSDRALYGHSAGGLFAIYALFEGQGTFHRFIIGSPSLWWDNRSLFGLEETYFQESQELQGRAFFSVGRDENDEDHPKEGGWGRMVTNFVDLVELLEERDYEGLDWKYVIFEDENHQSVFPVNISRGFRFIYGSWPN